MQLINPDHTSKSMVLYYQQTAYVSSLFLLIFSSYIVWFCCTSSKIYDKEGLKESNQIKLKKKKSLLSYSRHRKEASQWN